jgi:hypothetical protein
MYQLFIFQPVESKLIDFLGNSFNVTSGHMSQGAHAKRSFEV